MLLLDTLELREWKPVPLVSAHLQQRIKRLSGPLVNKYLI